MTSRSPLTHIAGWAAVLALFGLSGWLFVRGMGGVRNVNSPAAIGTAAVGAALPDAPLQLLSGRATSLRAFIGHPLWINFFATWCAPCKAEVPEIERRYLEHRSAGLVVLGVDQQESAALIPGFEKRYSATYPMAIDEGPAAAAFRVQTIPVSVFVDAGGTVRDIRIGQMQPSAMDDALAKILP